jgi:hypothetical protein
MARNRDAERQAVELMRAAVFAHYGESCTCCGTTDDLAIDHVNGDGKEQRIALFGLNPVSGRMYRWIIEQGFPEGFQTMCRPCNTSKGVGSGCRLYHGAPLTGHKKWCPGCQRVRDKRTDFTKASGQPDGLNIRCKECTSGAAAAWRARNQGKDRYVSVRPGTGGAKVVAYLTKHGVTQAGELAAALGKPIEKAANTLGALVQAGHIERPAYGLYCLPGQWDQSARQRRVYTPPPEGWQHGGNDWAAGTTWTTKVTGLRVGNLIFIIGASRERSTTAITQLHDSSRPH